MLDWQGFNKIIPFFISLLRIKKMIPKIILKFELADNIIIKTGNESEELLPYYFSLYSKISEYFESSFGVRIRHFYAGGGGGCKI